MAGTLRPEGSIDEKYGLLDSYINVLEKEGEVVRKEGIENEIRKEIKNIFDIFKGINNTGRQLEGHYRHYLRIMVDVAKKYLE